MDIARALKNRIADIPGGKKLRKEFTDWVDQADDVQVVRRAKQLWAYLNSGKASGWDKAIVVAALLYLMSPVDLVPDTIPVLGWLDDIGVAAIAMNYVLMRLDEADGGDGKKGKKKRKKLKGKGKKAKSKKRGLLAAMT
jgi:uncharacterized membrane protein YkvA (DUF1232 family)